MSLPGEGPGKIGEAVLAESLATFAPVVLAVAVTVAITVGGDGLVAKGTAQAPRESLYERERETETERKREREREMDGWIKIHTQYWQSSS